MASKLLDRILFGRTLSAEVGIGSFLTVDIESIEGRTYKLWVYLASWALTIEGHEKLSSDDSRSKLLSADRVLQPLVGKRILSCDVLDESEIHLVFEGGISLEIWSEAADPSEDLLKLYQEETYVGSLTYPLI